jgi:4-amino-4-deoxy-L-arabinose transferase-like glycosyltransferase
MTLTHTRRRWLLALFIALAAAVRIYAVAQPRVVWGDEPFYLWLGRSLLDGQGYQFFGISGTHFAPLFPLAAAVLAKVAGLFGVTGTDALMVGSNTLHLLCGAALVLPVWGIAHRLSGEAAGLAAALVAALFPALVVGPPLWGTMTEPLYLLLVAGAWWALVVAVQDGKAHLFIVAGAALALAYLVRTEALILLLGGLAVGVLISAFLRPAGTAIRRPLRSSLAGAGLALLAFGLLITPYVIAMHAQTGQWQIADESGAAYVSARSLAYSDMATFDKATWGIEPASGEVYLFSPASDTESLPQAIAADPRGFLKLVRTNIRDFAQTLVSPRLIHWWLLPLIALGLFTRPWSLRRLRGELMLATSLVGALSFLPFFIQDRYIATALLPAVVWIGAGIVQLGEWLEQSVRALIRGDGGETRESGGGAHGAWVFVPLFVLVALLLLDVPRLRGRLQVTGSFQPAHVAIADRLREAAGGRPVRLMSRYPAIAFHAGTAWSPTPAASWDEVLAYARKHGATYIAVDQNEVKLRPQLAALLSPSQAPAGVELVATVDEGKGPVVLYRIK